ncbi:MAG: hypothetical protein K9N55_20595 [Phycisphaerae bacterium]|nr:hypothetical protein [Phycisphaerae bacterium]
MAPLRSHTPSAGHLALLITLLFCTSLPCLAEILPGPLTVQVRSDADKPIAGVTVHVGPRMAISNPTGSIVLDGIPQGTYDLLCNHPGFQTFKKTISLPNGQRDLQQIVLQSEVLSPLNWQITEETTGESVGQARIHLTPRTVQAALSGPLVFSPIHTGAVRTQPVPGGTYQLKIEAPGFQTLEQVIEHTGSKAPVQFKLKALCHTLSYAVQVQADNGSAIRQATVTLWEVYPLGMITTGLTNAQGLIQFSDLKIGVVNPVTPDNALPVTHRPEVVVRVEADGYMTTQKSVRLSAQGQCTITLASETQLTEEEPNDDKGSAQSMALGQSMAFTLQRPTDQDWFAFDLPEATQVTLSHASCPVSLSILVFNTGGEEVASCNTYARQTRKAVWNLPEGHYVIRVTVWGQNSASKDINVINLTGRIAADPLEFNNTPSSARPIQIGQHMRGLLFPIGDEDVYTLHLDRPGCLRLESCNTPDVQRAVAILDAGGTAIGTKTYYASQLGTQEWQLPSGDYRVSVTEWQNNGCSLDPYDFRFVVMTDDGVDDPPLVPETRVSAVRYLPLNARTFASIMPVGDRDLYTLNIPSKGTLHIHQGGPTELSTRLLDHLGNPLAAKNTYASQTGHYTLGLTQACTLILDVTEWNNNGWSPLPYELQTCFDPAGEIERLLSNDTPETAAPVELGAMIRDNILPMGDQDWYQFFVDQPGLLTIWHQAPTELSVTLHNAQGDVKGSMNTRANTVCQFDCPVIPGLYRLHVSEWNNNAEAADDYALKVTLNRALPGETPILTESPIIPLKLSEAQPCAIEHYGDIERFQISLPAKGDYAYWIGGPLESSTRATDTRTGKPVFSSNVYAGASRAHAFSTDGPMELLLTINEWNNNSFSMLPNWIMITPKGGTLVSAGANWTVNPINPTEVTFAVAAVQGVESLPQISLDINGDNQPDATLSKDRPQTLSFPKQGLYRVKATGSKGSLSAKGEFWVQATGQPVRAGIHVMVATPGEGEMVTQTTPVLVTALSYEGKPIRQVSLQVNGKTVGTDYSAPYEFDVPWSTLAGGERTLTVTATDTAGKQASSVRKVHVTDYFNLLPGEGAVVTGNDIVVSWDGGSFGPAKVRYRLKGAGTTDQSWQEVIGQNGTSRRVRLTALEPDQAYEFQPTGGSEPGPIRQVTRVRGLAFTDAHYGGAIQRDYDQRLPIGVRNHADEPRIVRLRCDQPKDSLLLAEFIGDGEKGRPVELGPGEQRVFTLGFSAQDVIKELHTLPIYIQSEDGFSDQADVAVRVKLPRVDLTWKDITPENETGLGRVYELMNNGDTLTDLQVIASQDQVTLQPEVTHGLLQAGQRERFEVYPKLYDGFTSCEDQITATAIGKRTTVDYRAALKPGESVHRLDMTAGLDPVTGEPNDIPDAIRAARRMVGQYLSGGTVDWSQGTDPQDTNHDGKPDRWTVLDDLNQTQWFGRDTDNDGVVDFAQADVGIDGEIDHSSLFENGQWRNTNLLDAWLEMNFTIPQNRARYQAHDLDIVVNGQIAGQLKQTIPEGNYRFPLSPTALAWSEDGKVAVNQLEINSRFLNFAHYAISSDFQFKTRLLSTDTFMVGTSREDALNRLYDSDPGLSTDSSDFSLSSEDLKITPISGIKKGDPVTLTGTVRNLGTGSTQDLLQIGLFLAVPGTKGQEMERLGIAPPGMMTDKTFRFVWAAAPGNHSLRVVVDPDNLLGETNLKNNAAIINLFVPGQDAKPTLEIIQPEDKLVSEDGQIHLLARAQDDTGIVGLDVFVGYGAAQPLYRTDDGFAGRAQLQPGVHRLRFRATDSGGQHTEEARIVTIKASRPICAITSPLNNEETTEPTVRIRVDAPDVKQVGVRVNNGPWSSLKNNDGTWTGSLDLPFGPCKLEAVAIDDAGMRSTTQQVTILCSAQPEEPKEEEAKKEEEKTEEGKKEENKEAEDNTPKDVAQDNTARPKDQTAGQGNPNQPKPQTGNKNTPPLGPQPDQGNQPGNGKAPGTPGADPGANPQTGSTEAGPNETGTPKKVSPPDVVQPEPLDIPEADVILPPIGVTPKLKQFPASPASVRAPRSTPSRAPSGFAYNRQRKDWYCPNRPNIKVKFKLPEWLTKEEFDKILKKGPDSPEFKALESRLLAGYWMKNFGKKIKGQTMDEYLKKYKDMLLKRCDRLDQADGKLPDFLQSLGLAAKDPPTDPKELAAWRDKMKELTEVYWLRLLATEDPSTVIKGMKQRAEALGKFDEGAQMAAEAVMKEIEANQKITQDVLEALPFTGDALDVIAVWTGESLSGEKLGPWERFFRAACVAGPVALEETLKRSPRAQEALGQFVKATGEMGSNMKNSVLKRLGMNIDQFDEVAEGVGKFLTKERHLFTKNADEVAEAAKTAFKQSAEGIEDLKQMKEARKASQETVDELDKLVWKGGKAGDADMEDLIIRMQKDKTAQTIINGPDVLPDVRKKANETMKKIYKDTDAPTMTRIKNSDDVKQFAKDNGLDPDKLEVSVWNPSNTDGLSPGDPGYVDEDLLKMGRDRDVTYQITGIDANGNTVALDVHDSLSRPIYEDEFFRRCHGKGPEDVVDAAEAKKFATDMDQMVTSKWHPEAYNTSPEVPIKDWLTKGTMPPVARPQDIRDTIMVKSDHWFDLAAKAGQDTAQYSKDMAEGMRQATKQWDNIVAKRAALYSADIPPSLEKAMDIFKKVETCQITPKQAEAMLKELGKLDGGLPLTPKNVVNRMAFFFEATEKGPGKAFKAIKTRELANALDNTADLTRKSEMIENAYKSGHITGVDYCKLRQGSFKLPPDPTPAQKEALKTWASSAWHRRGINLQEKKEIEAQVGPIN